MEAYFKKLYQGSRESLFEEIRSSLENQQKEFIVTANPETFMIGDQNPDFHNLLMKEDTKIIPDGIGLVKGANMLGIPVRERITGMDLVSFLLEEGNKQGKSLYLYGATPEVITKMCEMLEQRYPHIKVCGVHDGYSDDSDDIFKDILDHGPDLVFVALGIPRQELLIDRYFPLAKKGIFVGVGASFDGLSGMKQRAPQVFIDHNLEWLYRIVKEPKRMKRFYRSNIKFIWKIQKLKRGAKRGG